MIFEIVWSRILWPYFWTWIFVWTSLIGIILWSLSVGYYTGWKIADKNPNVENLSLIILLSAILIWCTLLIKDNLLVALQTNISNIKIASIIASVIIFSPASILLGMVSPYAAKLKIDNLKKSWSTIWNLYSLSTAGSIIWTFLAGFYLIPKFGTNKLLIILSITLVIVSIFISSKKLTKFKVWSLIIAICGLLFFNYRNILIHKGNEFLDIDTAYNRIWIYNSIDIATKKTIKIMGINNENHSSMFLDNNELVNEYTKYYHLAKHFNPDFKTTVMLGWAGYSYPKDFLVKYPEAKIDVVEIDPKITALAKKYFNVKDNPKLTIYHEDARVYLNKTKETYDVIFWDAFTSHYSVPYQLTTQEAIKKEYDVLNDNWVVILNIISSIEWKRGEFLRGEYATYKSIFPQVYIFPVIEENNWNKVQNIILVAIKSTKKQTFNSTDETLNAYLQHLWKKPIDTDIPILTDDYAPVDYYINKIM